MAMADPYDPAWLSAPPSEQNRSSLPLHSILRRISWSIIIFFLIGDLSHSGRLSMYCFQVVAFIVLDFLVDLVMMNILTLAWNVLT